MKYIHLKYDMIGAHMDGETSHPQKVIQELCIEYEKAVPQSICDMWQFFNVTNIPEVLPKYLEVFDVEPLEYIGWGLSEDDARKLSNLDKDDADKLLLNKKLEKERLDEQQRQKQKESSEGRKFSYNLEDIVITIGGVELKGFGEISLGYK